MNEFILGLDLDGVCANFIEGFKPYIIEEFNLDESTLPEITEWGFHQWGVTDEQFFEVHRKACKNHIFRDLEIIDGCADALWRISDAGIWIRVITHRLIMNWQHEIIVTDTVAWLDKYKIPYRDLCFLGTKPQIEADAYVDDAPHNIKQLRAADNYAIVFDQPYNRHLEDPRALNWKEAEDLIFKEATKKKEIQNQLPGIDSGSARLDIKKEI